MGRKKRKEKGMKEGARVARMSQAKVAGPPSGRASPRSELRGSLRRKWPDHLSSGHLGTQSCEDVSCENGRTAMGQGISEVRVARMSPAKVACHLSSGHISEVSDARMCQAKVAGPPWGRASPRSELRECLRRKWPDHLSSAHLGSQSWKAASGESGLTTMGHGISEVRVVRMSQA